MTAMAAEQPVVEIRDIHKRFGNLEVLKGVDFSVSEKEVVCLIGRSGSGKSTLLRCINLLERADSGTIRTSTPTGQRSGCAFSSSTSSPT